MVRSDTPVGRSGVVGVRAAVKKQVVEIFKSPLRGSTGGSSQDFRVIPAFK